MVSSTGFPSILLAKGNSPNSGPTMSFSTLQVPAARGRRDGIGAVVSLWSAWSAEGADGAGLKAERWKKRKLVCPPAILYYIYIIVYIIYYILYIILYYIIYIYDIYIYTCVYIIYILVCILYILVYIYILYTCVYIYMITVYKRL